MKNWLINSWGGFDNEKRRKFLRWCAGANFDNLCLAQ